MSNRSLMATLLVLLSIAMVWTFRPEPGNHQYGPATLSEPTSSQ